MEQEIRFHCLVSELFDFAKPKSPAYTKKVLCYAQGGYELLSEKFRSNNWNLCKSDNINTHANSVTNSLISITKFCIPTKYICTMPRELPWVNNSITKKYEQGKKHSAKQRVQDPQTTGKHSGDCVTV